MLRLPLLLGGLLLLVTPTLAQIRVTGTVVDAETGAPLPAASIQVDGTYRGTITNSEGAFDLRLEELPAALLVRFIGYETARVPVEGVPEAPLRVALTPVTYELGQLVVTDEDPAVGIMRQVIARKQVWREALETYRAEAYNRFTLANDTGIVSVIESLTEAFWDRERGTREIVRSRRQTNNLDVQDYLPAAQFVLNFYDDNVEVAGYRFIGVTHPKALRHYDFTLEGIRQLDDRAVYDIRVQPKNALKSAFEGRVAVLDEAFALLEVELRPSEAFLFPPPIERYDVTYAQQFSASGGEAWLPVDFRAQTELEVAFQGLLRFPEIHIDQVSRLTNYAVNVPLPDSLYATEEELAVDTVAVRADVLLDEAGAAVPLTAREVQAYEQIDSTMTLERAYQPTGPLARFIDTEDSDGGAGGEQAGWRRYVDLEPMLWYNRVDGANLGLGVDVEPTDRLTLTGRAGYRTGLEDLAYGAGAELALGAEERLALSLDYAYGTARRWRSDVHLVFVNSLDVLLAGEDYYDYYHRERLRLEAAYDVPHWPVDLAAGLNLEAHGSLATTTAFDLLGDDAPPLPNAPINAGQLRSVTLEVGINHDDVPLGLFGQRSAAVRLEHSLPDLLGSDFAFTQVEAEVNGRLTTLAKRRMMPAALDVRLVGGTFRGTLPVQRFGIMEAAQNWLTPFGALRTLEGRPYEGEQYAAVFWEHTFRTLPFELIGWRWPVKQGYSLIVHGGHGRTWLSDTRRARLRYAPHTSDGWHHEVGLSLSGLFNLLRLDVTTRLDAPGWSVGVGAARLF